MYQEEYDKKAMPEPAEQLKAAVKPKRAKHTDQTDTRILADGMQGMLVRLSKCCSPVPGDEIAGFITKGKGVSIHRTDCHNITNLPESEKARLIPVSWDSAKSTGAYNVDVNIIANDRKGLFSDISRACDDMDVNIAGVNLKTNSDYTVSIAMTLTISSTSEMSKILRALRGIQSVLEVYRGSA